MTESEAMTRELEANLSLVQAELRLAQLTYQRHLSLAKQQAVSQQELDKAKTDVEVKKRKLPLIKRKLSVTKPL